MRKLVFLNLFVALSFVLSASGTTPEVVEKVVTATTLPAAQFKEAPMLANLVELGKLPPVEERLPVNPMVVEPLVEQGEYGGDLRYGFTGHVLWGGMLYISNWEHPVTWKPDFSGIEPNMIAGWEVSDDATEFTWFLREGMKWSDGEPFTADDIMFYINDVLRNEELFPKGFGTDWIPPDQREGFEIEKIDDYTVKLIFPNPFGTFMLKQATWSGRQWACYPSHYLQQFHKEYNPDVDKLVAQDDTVEDWVALFLKKSPAPFGDPTTFLENPDLPTLNPWMTIQPLGAGTTVILERNPYYWKVDSEGNQLPYIDKIIATQYQDGESRTFAMLNGDLDFIKDAGDVNRELYFDAIDQGKPLEMKLPMVDTGNMQAIHSNMTTKDPVKNEVFNNLDFRIGLSHAINRAEIIEIVFKGQGEPAQVAPVESSPLYNEQLATQYIEYDVALANEYLDKVLPEKDADGFRLGPDGKRFSPVFSVVNDADAGQHWVQVAELLIEHWKEVGLDVQLNSVAQSILDEQRNRNDIEMYLSSGNAGGTGITAILDPRFHVPGKFWGVYGLGWHLWVANPEDENAVEPPQYVLDIIDKYTETTQQPTLDGQIETMRELMQLSADNFWVIGITRGGSTIQPIHERLGNVPDAWMHGWTEGFTKIIRPEQWYLNLK